MSAVATPPAPLVESLGEGRVVLSPISWEQFMAIDAALGPERHTRLTFLDDTLEIMAPLSRRHEHIKTALGSLVEMFFEERETDIFAFGSASLQQEFKKAGKEPDESFCVGDEKPVPDLVVEVVVSSGGIEKLEIYRRFAVPEVWWWEDDRLTIHTLRGTRYVRSARSRMLPGLEAELVQRCVLRPTLLQCRRTFREALRHME